MKYLGRYLKRPLVSASRLQHYCSGTVIHHYLDHRTGKLKLGRDDRALHFKMVRYSGFLANRKRGTLIPLVYEALQMQTREKPEKPGFAVLMKGFLGTDPFDMPSLQRSAALCRRSVWHACNGISVRKAVCNG